MKSLLVGPLLGQGGEFAFLLFPLAKKLGYLPKSFSSFLTTTIVAPMKLTRLMYGTGAWLVPRINCFVFSIGGSSTAEEKNVEALTTTTAKDDVNHDFVNNAMATTEMIMALMKMPTTQSQR